MGAITYNYWHSAGLTNVDPILANLRPDEFKRAFEDAASSANGIIFDLTDVDIDRAIQNGSRGFVRHNYTNAELCRVKANKAWLNKSSFYRDGELVNLVDGKLVFESAER